MRLHDLVAGIAAACLALSTVMPWSADGAMAWSAPGMLAGILAALVVAVWCALRSTIDPVLGFVVTVSVVAGGFAVHSALAVDPAPRLAASGAWIAMIGLWLLAWRAMQLVGDIQTGAPRLERLTALLVPAGFGVWMIFVWEIVVTGFGVPRVLLPPPSAIVEAMAGAGATMWADFRQTFIKSVLPGYAMGCGAGFVTAALIDRVPFLKRGLLPLGNLVSALPIVGIAPILVMWFGFDWQSKAAVVVVMTFFPMLVNTVTGLAATGAIERDLMRSYGASYVQTLVRVRLPYALPFIFNALKINSTLALIGAIVAEFFGTPIVGMGFRISAEVGRMNIDLVWGTIVAAAVSGSLFYGTLALLERTLTFWHPSYRR